MFNIAENRRLYFLISAFLIIPGIAAMIYSTVQFGSPVRLSIDFRGGSLYLVSFEEPATEAAIRDVYRQFDQDDPIIQQVGEPGDHQWQIRAGHFTPEEQVALRQALEADVAP